MIRAQVKETMHFDFVTTARAKGASEWRVLRTHVLRNAMLPVITMLGMDQRRPDRQYAHDGDRTPLIARWECPQFQTVDWL